MSRALPQVVLASHNAGKLAELRGLFAAHGRELIALPDRTTIAAEETASTFVENALIKARHAAALTGLPALADDSGLCVRALGSAPGVHSARYAGEHGNDAENNAALLRALVGITDRAAYFVCVLALVRDQYDPEPLLAIGRWHGEILDAPRGHNGFGYDPLFYVRELGCSSAELPAADKQQHSHRARAARTLSAQLAERAAP